MTDDDRHVRHLAMVGSMRQYLLALASRNAPIDTERLFIIAGLLDWSSAISLWVNRGMQGPFPQPRPDPDADDTYCPRCERDTQQGFRHGHWTCLVCGYVAPCCSGEAE